MRSISTRDEGREEYHLLTAEESTKGPGGSGSDAKPRKRGVEGKKGGAWKKKRPRDREERESAAQPRKRQHTTEEKKKEPATGSPDTKGEKTTPSHSCLSARPASWSVR